MCRWGFYVFVSVVAISPTAEPGATCWSACLEKLVRGLPGRLFVNGTYSAAAKGNRGPNNAEAGADSCRRKRGLPWLHFAAGGWLREQGDEG